MQKPSTTSIAQWLLRCSALAPLGIALLAYFEYVYLLGFPDGFVSAQQQAQRRLAYILIAVSIGVAAYLFQRSMTALRGDDRKRWAYVVVGYLMFVAGALWVDRYDLPHLSGSVGG